MGDGEDDSSYLPQEHGVNSSNPKAEGEGEYAGGEEEDVGDEELENGEGDEGINGLKVIGKDSYDDDDNDDDDTDEDDDDECTEDDEDEDEDEDKDDGTRPRKKRKLKNLISNYEFAPRVPPMAPPAHQVAPPRPSSRARNVGVDWTERETFVLLDAWGERFLQLGGKSLRSEDWQEVAERVSQETNIERTNTQCRNRLDTLKKKYKKEKISLEGVRGVGVASKWPFYRKMNMMLDNRPRQEQQANLSCGLDSGEYVFMDPKVYLNRANGLDEMRDSPGNSESWRDDGDEDTDSDGLPTNGKRKQEGRVDDSSFKLLANSIQKFSDIYEKIEVNKRKLMVELENMRMDFHRQLETQRRQLLERAQAEIAKIRRADNDDGGDVGDNDNDLSTDD